MRDLISDVNYCYWAVFVWYRSYNANDARAQSCTIYIKL